MSVTKLLSEFGIKNGESLCDGHYPENITVVDEKVFKDEDSAPAIRVFKEEGKDELWLYSYSQYISHYGNGESYYCDDYATQVVKKTKTVVTDYWENV